MINVMANTALHVEIEDGFVTVSEVIGGKRLGGPFWIEGNSEEYSGWVDWLRALRGLDYGPVFTYS